MSDSAETLFAILLISMALSQCGTCHHTRRIAEDLEQRGGADAGVTP